MRILVVEDEFTARSLLLEYTRAYGTHDVAVSGEEAVHAVKTALENKDPYGLIFLDVFLPNKLGPDVLKEVRKLEEEQQAEPAKVLIVSSLDSPSAKKVAADLTADGYVTKPLEQASIRDALTQMGIEAS